MKYRQSFGKWGEDLASKYLVDKGWKVIDRNARTTHGEIDIIAEQDGTIIFVEVKTRSTQEFGYPEEAITSQKRKHLIHSAEEYLQNHPEIQSDWRIDVIAIRRLAGENNPVVDWFENALA